MSVESILRRSFVKHANADFVILKKSVGPVGDDELNSFKKDNWTRLKSVRGYFDFNSQTETKGTGGERQGYDATAEILFDEIESISSQLDQTCRIFRGTIAEDIPITEEIAKTAWNIEKILPGEQTGNFSVIVIELKLPEKGNQVFLR
ncbi:hypothetical protein ACO1KB_19235 [Leptospira interrogans serovar Szwajizak]|uniref:hypothetical protein n=1 Tax=Leptospira interrogans TaxID=173 RepID=UPI00037DC3DC|nr:hypothetical protein [Leptospira interrogans]